MKVEIIYEHTVFRNARAFDEQNAFLVLWKFSGRPDTNRRTSQLKITFMGNQQFETIRPMNISRFCQQDIKITSCYSFKSIQYLFTTCLRLAYDLFTTCLRRIIGFYFPYDSKYISFHSCISHANAFLQFDRNHSLAPNQNLRKN